MPHISFLSRFRAVYCCLLLGILMAPGALRAQSLPVGSHLLDDYYRRLQLLGGVDSSVSFALRPLTASALGVENVYDPDGVFGKASIIEELDNGDGYLQVLPVSLVYNNNTKHPYGWNDGSMVPTRGGQARLSAGIFARY